MSATTIEFTTIDRLTGGRIGIFDVPCPLCGPGRKRHHQQLKTLRIWRRVADWAGYYCVHCEAGDWARDGGAAPPSREQIEQFHREAQEHKKAKSAKR